ncbi:hypothetical protein TVAG_087470 [Trichomonas vaginalis G3]|uniref:Uncharacterized protein n=1 Tax=Trichomonas vaginalis (strain ATCC PRA-98 / G3) TaxID=412133 RepID=A2FDS3_TRIV3|nr:hypothetical protein TVAGG3_0371350 [Trichomonas vaginalis G3]EAX96922.1 hypothetical protein TVAG_087470 [Trichomonas vaginalis G3]KAI5532631.1 hypothetical protein TVAGG3_0371350 [Trichomonas vaginalis G3]|eukprot:XP_001309852.1 hypothetical protein [Trichomonas vaginalis G3]
MHKKGARLSAAEIAKRKQQQHIAEIYAPERSRIYSGEEEFMNTLHPFEETGKNSGKKSSPIQKAIIYSIKNNGGKATEEQLLNFVKQKWDIITKYTERGFTMEPNIRVIRLNCAVKKRGRHLFLKVPKLKETWMLNSAPRKIPQKRINLKTKEISSGSDPGEPIQEAVEESEEEQNELIVDTVMRKDTFEYCIEKLFTDNVSEYDFNEICKLMEPYKEMNGLFKTLAYERRVRASLVVLKYHKVIDYIEKDGKYRTHQNIAVDHRIPQDPNNLDSLQIEKMTLDEFYNSIQSRFKT